MEEVVLFSAAIPFQGGVGHINEQWPDYWVKYFSKTGVCSCRLLEKKNMEQPKS
jgi:hypothetical protein